MKTIINGQAEISISVVSHGQINLIKNLLADINEYCQNSSLELILTLNLHEELPFAKEDFSFPIRVIHNLTPLGFAANHNQAFKYAQGQFFCVLNPDIRLISDPFTVLRKHLQKESIGMAAPLVVSTDGNLEDSARLFPTPLKILCKLFGGCKGSDYIISDMPVYPDWVGGMFMLYPKIIYEHLRGFNEKYFLYYEDVDICARLRLLGYKVVLCPDAKVVHNARRSSHGSLKYLKWHISSMLQFFCSRVFLQILWQKLKR